MPRRNHRVVFEPLDLSPERIQLGHHVDKDNSSRFITREEAARREADRADRQRNARINGGIDWEVCLVPGCGENLLGRRGVEKPQASRDHTLELPICFRHLAALSTMVFDKDDPLLVSAVADVIERREARAQSRREAAKKAWLTKTDGHIYYLRQNGLIKVGWSRDVEDRIRSYGPSAEVLVVYEATRDDETCLHRQLKPGTRSRT